jgi:hypothetical protein
MKKILLLTSFFLLNEILVAQVPVSPISNSEKFESGWWEWIEGSKISEQRLNEIAPHFPKPQSVNFSKELYDKEIYKWQTLYSFEYQDLINAPELTALNPYYQGYEQVIEMPYFIRPVISYQRPLRLNYGNLFEDEINYELDLQAWYFVFQPQKFKEKYTAKYSLPEWFSEENYRKQIIDKIENTKKHEEGQKVK